MPDQVMDVGPAHRDPAKGPDVVDDGEDQQAHAEKGDEEADRGEEKPAAGRSGMRSWRMRPARVRWSSNIMRAAERTMNSSRIGGSGQVHRLPIFKHEPGSGRGPIIRLGHFSLNPGTRQFERRNYHPRRADPQPEKHDCAIPHGKLTVVSGVSGSGKSSLAFDTIYAGGSGVCRSLSAYARQFPGADREAGRRFDRRAGAAIAIRQKNSTRNPRSTVATATEIYDYMRLLWARCGVVHCIVCNGIVKRDTVDEIASRILALGEGTRLHALFSGAAAGDGSRAAGC